MLACYRGNETRALLLQIRQTISLPLVGEIWKRGGWVGGMLVCVALSETGFSSRVGAGNGGEVSCSVIDCVTLLLLLIKKNKKKGKKEGM
jgi:hypothetical protein